MPLASPIGSGLGLLNPYAIRTIKHRLSVPVIVDAGVGTASDACVTMEQGVDGILMNTALAAADDPVRIEAELSALFPRERWTMLSHLLIFHGRRTCDARRPRCDGCALRELCPSAT